MVFLGLLCAGGALAADSRTSRDRPAPEKAYVGSSKCKKCHGDAYESFQRNSKKARSFAAVQKMKSKVTADELRGCYPCHATGYGKPGGFVSLESTPDLANAGCEVCHGPGSAHVASGVRSDIVRTPQLRDCETCHVASRIKAFGYQPILRAGAH